MKLLVGLSIFVVLIIGIFTLLTYNRDKTGEVSTKFKFFGSDKIVIETIEDPKVNGVSCFISRSKTGGISGNLGLAEDVPKFNLYDEVWQAGHQSHNCYCLSRVVW